MNNAELHFSQIPNVEKQRSRFDRSSGNKLTLNTGDLVPLYIDEVLPGDTVTADFAHVTRMTTPIAPVMDNAALDVYAFFVPNRLIWNHWKAFWGENEVSHWEQQTEYEIPQIEAPSGGWNIGSLADYMGIPNGIDGISINHLPFRAYCKIVNDWFRDENLVDPCFFNTDETTLTGVNKGVNYDPITDIQLGAAPFKVAKWHDYFTSALPSPQKGPTVNLPIGNTAPIKFDTMDIDPPTGQTWNTALKDQYLIVQGVSAGNTGNPTAWNLTGGTTGATNYKVNNMVADLSDAVGATINQLRQAFAIQRFYEAQARGGSRYVEFVKNIFGVDSPDARQQRAEYLGGTRMPINMDQVLQTSATDSVSPQGNTAAYSVTVDSENLLTYSATEHGYLMILGCIRTNHSYQQGIERFWNRKKWTDFYIPQFANLGEQGILLKELYAQGTSDDDEIFGYQEAWADYRYKPNRICGKLRSTASGSLDIWHYGDYYQSKPYLSADWIQETEANVARTLAVQNEPQFIMDTYVKAIWTRVMPMYSVPGLLDHH